MSRNFTENTKQTLPCYVQYESKENWKNESKTENYLKNIKRRLDKKIFCIRIITRASEKPFQALVIE